MNSEERDGLIDEGRTAMYILYFVITVAIHSVYS